MIRTTTPVDSIADSLKSAISAKVSPSSPEVGDQWKKCCECAIYGSLRMPIRRTQSVSSAHGMGPAFRQWHGTGPDPVQRLAVADDCGPVWWQSRWVAGSPVGWDHLWRCGGILSVGHPSGAAAGSPGPQGSARRAERSEPLWSWRFWGRLRCRAGKMPAAWRPSWREGRGAGQRPGDLPGAVVSGAAAGWLVFAGAGRTRRRGPVRRRRIGAGRSRTGRAAGRPSGPAIRPVRGWRW